MLAVTRHRAPAGAAGAAAVAPRDLRAALEEAVSVLRQRPGFVSARLGRAADDAGLWVLVTEWADVRAYRRALGDLEVKTRVVPVLSQAEDEPTAFELLLAADGADASGDRHDDGVRAADADVVGLGEAAAPRVPPQG